MSLLFETKYVGDIIRMFLTAVVTISTVLVTNFLNSATTTKLGRIRCRRQIYGHFLSVKRPYNVYCLRSRYECNALIWYNLWTKKRCILIHSLDRNLVLPRKHDLDDDKRIYEDLKIFYIFTHIKFLGSLLSITIPLFSFQHVFPNKTAKN